MNRIETLFKEKTHNVLSIFFMAGHPKKGVVSEILTSLEEAGADMAEIGIPFSDPLADGEVIQQAGTQALQNGQTLPELMLELKNVREKVKMPLLLMGYYNVVMQYGMEQLCKDAAEVGIDGFILPDLPAEIYEKQYKSLFEKYGLCPVFLITPQTETSRIEYLASLSGGFVYMVSSASTTGTKQGFSQENIAYFERIKQMKLSKPILTGFGISNGLTRQQASEHSNGVIVGSAFVKHLEQYGATSKEVGRFINELAI